MEYIYLILCREFACYCGKKQNTMTHKVYYCVGWHEISRIFIDTVIGAHLWPSLENLFKDLSEFFFFFLSFGCLFERWHQSLKVCPPCWGGVGRMVGGGMLVWLQHLLMSSSLAVYLLPSSTEPISGTWCSLSECQVQSLTSHLDPQEVLNSEEGLICCRLMRQTLFLLVSLSCLSHQG